MSHHRGERAGQLRERELYFSHEPTSGGSGETKRAAVYVDDAFDDREPEACAVV